jgi:hypothetical protein
VIEEIGKRPCVQEDQIYHILLILTDDVNHDNEAALQAIVKASLLPMSIIIVGIGNADFSSLKKYEEHPLKTNEGLLSVRDIVQVFESVPMFLRSFISFHVMFLVVCFLFL